MPTVIFHRDSGETACQAEAGLSVMRTAIENGVYEVVAECGGVLACATCHVYLDPPSQALFAPPSEEERDMLEYSTAEVRENSRLSCQLILTDDMDVVEVHTS